MAGPLVVALNPSVDVEWRLDHVRSEEKNVIRSVHRWPGGKGVNVARWLRHLGVPGRLLLPLGGAPGREMRAGLAAWKIRSRIVPIQNNSRVNVIVTPDAGPQLRFNETGPPLSRSDWQAIKESVADELRRCRAIVFSGSLPRGLPVGSYAELIRLAHRAGVPSILDCEGPSLATALPSRPFLVKPNEHELALWAGRRLGSNLAVQRAALDLSRLTHGWVFVSLGSRGAILVQANEGLFLQTVPPKIRVRNTVGAGDALLAAVTWRFLLGEAPEDWLRWGVATGTTMASLPADQLPEPDRIARLAKNLVVSRI